MHMSIHRSRTVLDFKDGVRDAVQPLTDSLQLRQPLLKPIPRPLTVAHLQQRALKSPNVPAHLIQAVPVLLDVLRHLLLDFVELGDDLILSVSCQLEGERVTGSG